MQRRIFREQSRYAAFARQPRSSIRAALTIRPIRPSTSCTRRTSRLRECRRDRAGFVDWMRLLNGGRIKPRASVAGSEGSLELYLDIMLNNSKQMPWARFPHRSQNLRLDWANCRPEPVERRAGAAKITMESGV